MLLPRLIAGLSEIAHDHDALICDIWGVVHDGQAPFPEAAEALIHVVSTPQGFADDLVVPVDLIVPMHIAAGPGRRHAL